MKEVPYKVVEFVKENGLACGGNWTQMLMSSIKRGAPNVFSELPDKSYEFSELVDVIKDKCLS